MGKTSERKGTPASLSCRVQRAQTSRLCFSPTASTSIEAKLVRVETTFRKSALSEVPVSKSVRTDSEETSDKRQGHIATGALS